MRELLLWAGNWAWVLGGSKQTRLISVTEDGVEGPAAVLLCDSLAILQGPSAPVGRLQTLTLCAFLKTHPRVQI